MAQPVATVRVDWFNLGTFGGPYDAQTPLIDDTNVLRRSRGRSADFSAEAMGDLSFVLENNNDAYTPDRNWHDCPSFEVDTAGWSVAAIASLTAAGTSITKVTDNAGQGGTKAGEAVLTATLNSATAYAIPWRFVSGVTYSCTVWLKSMSGTLNVRAGLASAGTPADIATSGANITTSWAAYTFTWTPSADRTDAVFFVRTNTALAATLRIDAVQVNPGSTSNTYIEAPTKGQLVPGRPVHVYGTISATDYPLFYGFIERITPRPEDRLVEVTFYDVLRRMSETSVVVAGGLARSARELRLAVLESFERGNLNLLANPSFESNTTGWDTTGGTLSRLTTDAAPVGGSDCGQFASGAAGRTVSATARLAPVFYNGEIYRFSVYLRCSSFVQGWVIGITNTLTGQTQERTVVVTTTWTRFTVTLANAGGVTANDAIKGYLTSTANDTVRLDAAAITRGGALYPYADTGTGRYMSLIANGSFDGNDTTGWGNAWKNLVTNGSFETNTAGWATATDSFITTGATLTRDTGQHKYGSASGKIVGLAGQGTDFAITGTFLAGVTYVASVWVQNVLGGATQTFGIGSNGTPADFAEEDTTGPGVWTLYSVNWTPSSNRTDARFYIKRHATGGSDFYFDGVMVHAAWVPDQGPFGYADTGPLGGGVPATSIATSATSPKYGSRSLTAVLPATTNAGIAYDFLWIGSYFQSGQAFTLSLWLNVAAGTFPFKVGLSGNKGDGTFDETSTTGTVTAGSWQQVTLTWTPSGDRSSAAAGNVWLTILQTNATARTIFVDGVRIIPGSSADAFEMAQWNIPQTAGSDILASSAAIAGTALSGLTTLNDLSLARHFIRPTMASPWYEYVVIDRDTFAALAVDETISEDVAQISDLELDRASIVNAITVSFTGGSDTYSDDDSVGAYGPRPGQAIDGSSFFPDRTIPDIIGPALVARYKDGVLRPRITRSQAGSAHVARDLADLLDISVERFLIRHMLVSILTETLTVSQSGRQWDTELVTEQYAH